MIRNIENSLRFWLAGIATALALMAASGPAHAGAFEVRAGYYFDADEVALGFGALTSIGSPGNGWFFNPNLEIIPGDRVDAMAANVDFHYDFATSTDLAVWAGGGPALFVTDHERFDDTDVEPAINAFLGAGSREGGVRPFFQLKSVLMDDPEASLMFGVRF